MNIVKAIEDIVKQLSGSPAFSYMGKYEHNQNDDLDYSRARVNMFEIEEPGFKRNLTTGSLRRRYPVFLEFVRIADEHLTALQRDAIIEEMIELAAEFLGLLEASGAFEVPEQINGLTIINRYDQNVVGYELNLPLVAIVPMSLC